MAKEFRASAPNPNEVFLRIQQWAAANGFQLMGDAIQGRFGGTPGGLAGLLIGNVNGTYSVEGTEVTIRVDKDLPTAEVARRLSRFGITVTRAA